MKEKEWIPTRISPDLLDTIGRSFRFRHDKGIAEWLKNSLDSYLRLLSEGQEVRAGNWPVLIDLVDGGRKPGPNLTVLDFGGTTLDKIENFFLHWGDTSAASHGRNLSGVSVTGGHGNGGKFYMREMWKKGSRFLTWRNGLLHCLVVDKSKPGHSGFWESKNIECTWREVVDKWFPSTEGFGCQNYIHYLEREFPEIIADLNDNKRGISAVTGFSGHQALNTNDLVAGRHWVHQKLIDAIRRVPQARRPIKELHISVSINQVLKVPRLHPETVECDPEFTTRIFELKGEDIGLPSTLKAELEVRKASGQLVGGYKHLHSLSVIDDTNNPVATYPMRELPIRVSPTLAFMHGELVVSYQQLDQHVTNDREKLVSSDFSDSLLAWCANNFQGVIDEIDKQKKDDTRHILLERADHMNKLLNDHAKKFLEKLETEILVDFVDDPLGGGYGDEGDGLGRGDKPGPTPSPNANLDRPGKGGNKGEGGKTAEPGKEKNQKRPRFPIILLSGYHPDPVDPNGASKNLEKMHPPLYQDENDREQNVWWINTSHAYAEMAIGKPGGTENPIFRNYHLFMFRDVVQRESMRLLQRREAEIELDRLETELDEISNRFLGELPYHLADSLMDENL